MIASVAANLMVAVASGSPAQLAAAVALRDAALGLQDRVDELEAVIGLKPRVPPSLPLTPNEADILGMALAASGVLTKERIAVALYGGRPDCDQPASPLKSIKVMVCRLRKKLAAADPEIKIATTIEGDYHGGLYMTAANKSRVRALLQKDL